MKFSGSNKSGRHLFKNIRKRAAGKMKGGREKKEKVKWTWKKRLVVISGIVVASVFLLAASAFVYAKYFVKKPAPDRSVPWVYTPPSEYYTEDDPTRPVSSPGRRNPAEIRDPGFSDPDMYTFLVLATDDGSNTDTIMVCSYNSQNRTMDIVSIPRDTMVNVRWNLKKVNSILANMRLRYRGQSDELEKAMEDTVDEFANFLGFRIDYWFLVNMRAFVSLVNAVDGVDFYVPVNMNYDDYDGNLHIHYSQGMHHLRGQQALEVLRFRNTYAAGDIRRISVQQDFLTAAAQQILAKRSSISVFELAEIVIGNVKTNMNFNDLTWFGEELIQMDADNITFLTMPGNYLDGIGEESYVTIYVDEWLEIVNNVLSPFSEPVTAEDVSILTRGSDRRLYVTNGIYAGNPSWGASSRGPDPNAGSSGASPTGVPAASPTPAPSPGQGGERGDDDTDDSDDSHDTQSDDDSNQAEREDGGGRDDSDSDESAFEEETTPPDGGQDADDDDQGDEQDGGDGEEPPAETIEPLEDDPYGAE